MAAGRLDIPYSTPALDGSGNPATGATLLISNTGVTAATSVYSDSGLTTAILNPLTADSAGRFLSQGSVIWVDASTNYDVVLTIADGTVITMTDLAPIVTSSTGGNYLQNPSPVITGAPQAPTPALTDVSETLATTRFVFELASSLIAAIPAYVAPTVVTDVYKSGANGYYWHAATGRLEQWGVISGSFGQGPQGITFPVAFDATPDYPLFSQLDNGSGVSSWLNYENLTTGGMTCYIKRGAGDNQNVPAITWVVSGKRAASPS